ncbi:haloacid dehalogenase (HAD) superfamily protein [Zea mays]|uniref:Haloacid dehalogenase (HAD) superfamily protein n=1 Tax=Zea mays TaxID=4577 RepID=A0A1D6N9J2_MAIZE|nr:haloacid dehalogenase (HAD) superfamily protein [Zea mays]
MLPSPPVLLRPCAARASPLPPPRPRAANPNTESATTTTAATSADRAATMGAAAWWRRALGQRFNPAGVAAVAAVAASKPRLALPHVSVQDIRWLDWAELRRAGFRGVVFDKDNTLTAPYAPALWPPLAAAFDQCRATFPPGALAIYSNSADIKKPGGLATEIESYFGCSASNLVLVGDRYFTDVVYGNKNGFLTVLTEPLNITDESYIVKRVRKLEAYIISYWYKKGHKPIEHPLLPDARRIVKFDPYDDSVSTRI